jgi:hypothetical protein
MQETMTNFFQVMIGAFNDENTTFEKKIELFVENYFDIVTKEPDILLFILGEIRSQSENFTKNLPAKQMFSSVFIQQFQEKVAKEDIKLKNPLHLMLNLMGLTAFPFLAKPIISGIIPLSETQYNTMMQERKKLIPVWIEEILKVS